jgi:uncharacterized protein YbjT (DUF2867 family)
VDAADIAAVAALAQEGHHQQNYDVSGPRAMTFAQAVEEIATATGRQISCVAVEESEDVRHLMQQGYGRSATESQAARSGGCTVDTAASSATVPSKPPAGHHDTSPTTPDAQLQPASGQL